MTVRHVLLRIDVLLEDLDFTYRFTDNRYRIDRLKVVYGADPDGTLQVVALEGGGRKIRKNGEMHKLYSSLLTLWEWALVPREIRDEADAAALAESEKVRTA